jgi:ADP-ribose pyrophosphatase YjhB (NUDIX family)
MPKIYRFCPFCSTPLAPEKISGRRYNPCRECGFVDYGNARPTAGAVVVNDKNEVLLARRAGPPMKGYWNLPGGFLECDELPEVGVVRELKEETGLDIVPVGPIGIHMGTYNDPHQGFFNTINIYYATRVGAVTPVASDDASELRFFPIDQLPRMGFECDMQAIEDYRQLTQTAKKQRSKK